MTVGLQCLTGIMSLLILVTGLFQVTTVLLAIPLVAISIIWYLVLRGLLDESGRRSTKRWIMANFYLLSISVGLVPYALLSRITDSVTFIHIISGILCSAAMATVVLIFLLSDIGKKMLTALDSGRDLIGSFGKVEVHPGDVVLCDVKELVDSGVKDAREVIPYKDRFLHMLILGPTGGGKTSQVILPMVYQDVHNIDAGVTVLEPKGDLAREVAMMAEEMGRPYLYFDPSVDNCPFFNPLVGVETDVIENAVTTFLMLNPDSPQYFKDLSEQLVRNSLKVLKRLDKAEGIDGKYSTFIWMSRLLQNNGGQGRELVQKFAKLRSSTPDEAKENADIASWFLNEYFMERSKIYENSSGIRAQVAKVIANQYLRNILNPDVEKGEYNQIDFDKHLAEGGVICISTAQGLLRDLGKFLGYFIILQLQSAVFRRPGNEDTRRAHFLYIDEFQTYSTPGFSDMLTQGRSYRVASHLATQARAQMAMGGGRDGRNFVELVSTNARNLVIFPGASKDDAEYYSKQFGEYEKQEVVTSYTRKRFNLITGGFDRLGHPSESVRIQDKLTAVFTPSEIIYRPFGEIIYCIIKNNSIQTPKVGKVKWLDSGYDKKLKQMIDEKIVVHEIRSSHTLSESSPADTEMPGQAGDFSWEESELSDPSEAVSFAAPASSSDSSAPAPSEMSAQEEASLYDDPASPGFDIDFMGETPYEEHHEEDDGLDDLHADPLDYSDSLI